MVEPLYFYCLLCKKIYDMKQLKCTQFYQKILKLFPGGKALVNLLLALASNKKAPSVTSLSNNRHYNGYQYTSIGKSIARLASDRDKGKQLQSDIQDLAIPFFERESDLLGANRCYLIVDSLPYIRRHSPTLAERCYVPVPNCY